MLFVQMLPVILSLVVLGAHFSRHGQPLLVFLSLALIGLLAVPRIWAARLLQAVLLLGAAEWVRTLVVLTQGRIDSGAPVARMAVILAVVATITAASALLFRTQRARARFRSSASQEG